MDATVKPKSAYIFYNSLELEKKRRETNGFNEDETYIPVTVGYYLFI